MDHYQVIVITDGDPTASKAVEIAAKNLGIRVISASEGHPTHISGNKIADLVYQANSNPIVVFLDDRGDHLVGKGEQALLELANQPNIEIIGAVAVASACSQAVGVSVDISVNNNGQIIDKPINKYGTVISKKNAKLKGDTVDVLQQLDIPVIVGLGDPGKQQHHDDIKKGAPLTTKALSEIIKRSNKNA